MAEDAGATRREQPDRPNGETRREASTDDGATRREGGPRRHVSVNLPEGLKARFTILEELAPGAEATVLVAEEIESGERRVLKIYHGHVTLDRDAVEKVLVLSSDADGRHHIVRLYEVDVEADRWYEVQEHCEHQSLRTVLDAGGPVDVDALAQELGDALAFLEGRLYLRDLKPENLLVRTLEPFDIVVTDFGLMRDAGAGSVRWTSRAGTFAYMPPEAGRDRLTPAWDWWSAGMVIAEVALGRHPLADAEGRMPKEARIIDLVHSAPVDLDGIADERLRNLCRGLLVRDHTRRWRRDQVLAWQDGQDPPVPPDLPLTLDGTASVAVPDATVSFGGTAYRDPVELAAALQQRWDYALTRLFEEPDRDWLAELERFLRAHDRARAAQLVAGDAPASPGRPARLAELLIEMDPDLDPVFNGLRLTPAGLARAARQVVGGESSGLQRQLTQIRDARALSLWASLPGMTRNGRTAGDVEQTWLRDCLVLDQLAARTRIGDTAPSGDAIERAKARLLLCAVNPRQLRSLRRKVQRLRNRRRQVPAWRNLAEEARSSAPAAALALILAPEARFVTAEQRRLAAEARAADRGTGTGTATVPDSRRPGRLTPEARGFWMSPQLTLLGIALLYGPIWLVGTYRSELAFFVDLTSARGTDDLPVSADTVFRVAEATPWFVALAVSFAVVQAIGIRLEGRLLRPAAGRAFAVVVAAVQAVAAAAMALGAAMALLLAYVSFTYDDRGFPDGYVPGACGWLVLLVPVAVTAPFVVLVCAYRLAAVVLGAQVVRR